MKDIEQSRMLLSIARKEVVALQGMIDPEVFVEEIFGFHVQQAAEKAFKAWLALLGVAYSKTHDISLLLAELDQSGVDTGGFFDMIEYNVFAVQYRYETYDIGLDALDRKETIQCLTKLVAHVEEILAGSDS